ncbi:MAG: alpha/beta fold hydrolase [Parvibaculaceae bacterium]
MDNRRDIHGDAPDLLRVNAGSIIEFNRCRRSHAPAEGTVVMVKQVLFVRGGGEGAHAEDAKLARSLQSELGRGYKVHFPMMPNEQSPEYAAWRDRLSETLAALGDDAVLVGHSLGASVLIKMLVDQEGRQAGRGLFLIAAPYWGDQGWAWEDVELPKDAGARLSLPLFFFHSRDDEIVPYAHLDLYLKMFPHARMRRLSGRNHQLDDDLSEVAADIMTLG